jgi:cytochrome c oxidase cbb3-type subunit 1
MERDGSLTYSFMETMIEMYPYWWARAVGGVIYLLGLGVFVYNLILTVRKGKPAGDAVGQTA